MLAHLRVAGLRYSTRSWRSVRSLSSSAVARQEEEDETGPSGSQEPEEQKTGIPEDPVYERWLASEGRKYEDPKLRPRNWLGGEVPFPLNPTFKPPPPISDNMKTRMYEEYMSNPETYNIRELSERYGISLKRVDAILRLKGLEEHWRKEENPLQTGFLAGMEKILGVSINSSVRTRQGANELGEDATEADAMSDATADEKARERYQRLFWEPVLDGKDSVLPTFLDKERASKAGAEARRAARMLPKGQHVVERPGRPTVTFVDVGTRFVQVKELAMRAKESRRRSLLKQHKRERGAQEGQERLAN